MPMSEMFRKEALDGFADFGQETKAGRGRQSMAYRLKASRLGRMANAESDEAKMLPLLNQAMSWILLAENEESLAGDLHDLQ
jgi:hypothetical protein